MATPKWPLPKYDSGPHNHVHALGVIISNYCEFESELFALFTHHWDMQKIARKEIESFYFENTEAKRLDLIKLTFSIREQDQKIKTAVNKLIEYFEWCAEARNTLMHTKHSPPFFGNDKNFLYLSKRNRKNAGMRYIKLNLKALRTIADQIKIGSATCDSLRLFLYFRDVPRAQWAMTHRAIHGHEPEPSLEIPDVPEKLTILETPHTPPAPRHLRKPSHP